MSIASRFQGGGNGSLGLTGRDVTRNASRARTVTNVTDVTPEKAHAVTRDVTRDGYAALLERVAALEARVVAIEAPADTMRVYGSRLLLPTSVSNSGPEKADGRAAYMRDYRRRKKEVAT